MTECQWGPGDGAGRYCLTHEAWMRAVIGTQCPVGELQAQVQRVREACDPFGPMGSIAVWRILRALDGDDE
jgi:hypothetical protein